MTQPDDRFRAKRGWSVQQTQYTPVVAQDHRAVKRVTRPMLGFQSFAAGQATLVGIELMQMIKKSQMVVAEGNKGLIAAEPSYALAA